MTTVGQPSRRLHLVFSGTTPEVMPQVEAIGAFLREVGCTAESAQKLMIVAEEILANIARHAWVGKEAGRCSVDIAAVPKDGSIQVTLRMEDDGLAFDPTRAPEPDLEASLEERAIGGLGIVLIRSMTDAQTYRRSAARNIFEVTKRCACAQADC